MMRVAKWSALLVLSLVVVTSIALLTGSKAHRETVLGLYLNEMEFYSVPSHSMEPTVTKGAYVVVESWWRDIGFGVVTEPRIFRGTIIAFQHERNGTTRDYLKRVVGVPGDRVRVGQYGNVEVLIGGVLSDRVSYCEELDRNWVPYEISLDGSELFVLGDNCAASIDSRHFGQNPVNVVNMKGVALYAFDGLFDVTDLYFDLAEPWKLDDERTR